MEQMKAQGTAPLGGIEYTVEGALREAQALKADYEVCGLYITTATEALLQRSVPYYNLHREGIERLLLSSGISTDTAAGVMRDYVALLSGQSIVKLPLAEQMEVVHKVQQYRAVAVDQYGLYLLFEIYERTIEAFKEYTKQFKYADGHVRPGELFEEEKTVPVLEQKREFMERVIGRIKNAETPAIDNLLYAFGYQCLRGQKALSDAGDGQNVAIIWPTDFAGIDPILTDRFLIFIGTFGWIANYVNYYYLAKYAFAATEEELKEIATPPGFQTQDDAREYAGLSCLSWFDFVQWRVNKAAEALLADTEQEREEARREAINAKPQNTMRIPETLAQIISRSIYASVDGTAKMTKGILPIQAFIADYMKRNNLTEQISPRTVDKVIESINMLQWIKNVRPDGRHYYLETNISEFSTLCGYADANQEQKSEIMRAIKVLDGLFLVVWRAEGIRAVRVFTLEEVGLKGKGAGSLVFRVNAEVAKGRPNLISYNDYEEMRKNAKGQAKNRFRNQIIAKGQKEENALLDEVFGYTETIDNIKATGGSDEEVAKAKRTNTLHKSRDKKRIAQWFEEYKQNGWLEWYTYTKNAKGDCVYKWKRGNIPQEQGTEN